MCFVSHYKYSNHSYIFPILFIYIKFYITFKIYELMTHLYTYYPGANLR